MSFSPNDRTIGEVRAMKKGLECEIRDSIRKFEKETGMGVRAVFLKTVAVLNKEDEEIVGVTVGVKV